MTKTEPNHKIFEDIGHIKATQTAILSSQERIEKALLAHESRIRKTESNTVKLLTLSSSAAAFISVSFTLLIKWLKT